MMDPNDSGIITLDELLYPVSESFDAFLDTINSDLITGNNTNNNLPPMTPTSAESYGHTDLIDTSSFMNPSSFYTIKSKPVPQTPTTCQPETTSAETMSTSYKTPSYKCRTNLKQELMREKALEEERKEAERHRQLQARLNSSPAVPFTNNIQEHTIQTSSSVPPQVLKVQTRLENPTFYHMGQMQQKQVLQYLEATGGGGSVPPSPINNYMRAAAHIRVQQINNQQAVSAPATVQINSPTGGYEFAAPSPGPYSSLATSITSYGSPEDVNDAQVVNSILEMENSDPAGLSEILSNLNCSSVDGAGVSPVELREQKPNKRQSKYQAQASSLEDPSKFDKDRKRKDNHNNIERKRRFNINDRIKDLAGLLPKENEPYHKEVGEFRHHKGTILKASVDYITLLKRGTDERRTAELKLQNVLATNRKQSQRIHELEQKLKANGIPVPVSELSWKPTTSEVLNQLIGSPIQIKQEPDASAANSIGVDLIMDEQTLASLVGTQDPILTQTLLDQDHAQLQDHMDFV